MIEFRKLTQQEKSMSDGALSRRYCLDSQIKEKSALEVVVSPVSLTFFLIAHAMAAAFSMSTSFSIMVAIELPRGNSLLQSGEESRLTPF